MSCKMVEIEKLKKLWEKMNIEELREVRRNFSRNLVFLTHMKHTINEREQALRLIPSHKEAIAHLNKLIEFREQNIRK